MAERGKSIYTYLANGSNNVVIRQPGTLYSVTGTLGSGGSVRIDDAHSFPQGVFNMHSSSSNTVGFFTPPTTFGRGLGFNTGLVVAFSSNSLGVTVEYEPA